MGVSARVYTIGEIKDAEQLGHRFVYRYRNSGRKSVPEEEIKAIYDTLEEEGWVDHLSDVENLITENPVDTTGMEDDEFEMYDAVSHLMRIKPTHAVRKDACKIRPQFATRVSCFLKEDIAAERFEPVHMWLFYSEEEAKAFLTRGR